MGDYAGKEEYGRKRGTVMAGIAQRRREFSIWDSVVEDRILQFEELDQKYRSKCREVETLEEENEKLKEQIEEAYAKREAACRVSEEKDDQIQKLNRENADLRQWIAAMEHSTSWRMTKPVRNLIDKWKGRGF